MLRRRNFRAAGSLDHEKRPKTFAKTTGPAELSVAHGIRRHRADRKATQLDSNRRRSSSLPTPRLMRHNGRDADADGPARSHLVDGRRMLPQIVVRHASRPQPELRKFRGRSAAPCPPPACWGAPAVPSRGQPVAGSSAGFGWRGGARGGAVACRVDTIAEHSPERCSRRAPHRADGVRRLRRPPRAQPKLRSPRRPSLTRARRCSGTGSTWRTAHGGTGEQSKTRRRSAPPSPSTCLSRHSSGGLAGAARVAAGDAQRPSLRRFAPAPSP